MNYLENITILYWYSLIGINNIISNKDYHKENNIIENKINNNQSAYSLVDSVKNIDELEKIVRSFNGCDLKKMATNTVFSDGIKDAKIVLIGEAPGAMEDAQGTPFCGESGELLDNMLDFIGLSRKKNVYITNTIFWRPPANRRPTNEEIEICRPFLEKHIALTNAKLLILVGSTAVTTLLNPNMQITKIRQKYFNYTNNYMTKTIPTTTIFHPAYLLRQPMQKKITFYDLLLIKKFCEENGIL